MWVFESMCTLLALYRLETAISWPMQAKLEAASMYLMANKTVPGSNEHVLYLTAAVSTLPAPTQLLLEVRSLPIMHSCHVGIPSPTL